MGKQGSVGEMLETRGIVGHDVVQSWEEKGVVAVAMDALVVTRIVTQVGRRAIAGDGPFADAGESRGVVGAIGHGGIAHIVGGGHQRHLSQ